MRDVVFIMSSGNCTFCGDERSREELKSFKFAGKELDKFIICPNCIAKANPEKDFIQVRRIVCAYLKTAEEVQDAQLKSPEIIIEPTDSFIQKAVQRIKSMKSDYFVGVSKIIVYNSGSELGSVISTNPTEIKINLQNIKNNVNKSGLQGPELEKAIVDAIVETITHERGHVKDIAEHGSFQGGENAAEAESQKMKTANKSRRMRFLSLISI